MPVRSRSRSRSRSVARSKSKSRSRGVNKAKEIYYEPIVELFNQYVNEFAIYYDKGMDYFEDYINERCDKSKGTFSNLKPRLHSQKQQFLATISDWSAVPFQYKFLMETYVWLAFLFLGYEGGQVLGRHLLGPLLNWVFTSWLLSVLAFLVLPILAHIHFMFSEESNVKQRYKLLLFAIVLGIFTGTVFSHLYFDGCAFIIDLFWMMLKDSVNTTYLLLLSVDIGLLYVHMQYFLKSLSIVWEPWNEMHSWQLMALSVTHIIHSLCDYSLGWEHDQYEQQHAPPPSS
ncbi:unnamed protein product [Toxocara canis]|uniref:ADIPOR-like receptor n=1 Tax=Toxocara canis TaxID=6265 RepID=A0A183TY90_TOXCA|nr:unnamed protein product [Toxocara canis]